MGRVQPRQFACAVVSFAVAAALCVVDSAGARGAELARFIPLGSLPGSGYGSDAIGISADGSTVIGIAGSSLGVQSFRWTDAEGMIGIGDLPGGIFDSNPTGVSGDGSVIVGYGNMEPNTGYEGHQGFRWTQAGGMQVVIPDPALAGRPFGPDAVSADGSTVVGIRLTDTGEIGEAFRWSAADGMLGLGGFPSHSYGVSADGSVVVGDTGSQGFRWTSATGMVLLGALPGGGANSIARGVSLDGSVVVGGSSSALGIEAYRWTSAGMVGLGDLPGGDVLSIAYATSGDGSIVVGEGNTGGPVSEAFVWDAANGMRSVRGLLIDEYGLAEALAGWQLAGAKGVSADGRRIVGTGYGPDGVEGWIAILPWVPGEAQLSVPEPASWALVCTGLAVATAALARRKPRGRRASPLAQRGLAAGGGEVQACEGTSADSAARGSLGSHAA